MTKRAVVVSLNDPERVRDGGTLRVRAAAEILREAGATVSVLFPHSTFGAGISPVSGATGPMAKALSTLGEVKRHLLPMPTVLGARDRRLAREIHQSSIDLIQICQLSQFPYARQVKAPVWLDFMDVWSRVARREAATRGTLASLTATGQARLLARRELAACREASMVTAAGWGDKLLLEESGIGVHWLPTMLADEEFKSVHTRDRRPERVAGFLANFDYWPNRDAYAALLDHWLLPLRSEGWRVVVAGKGSAQMGPAPAGVEILGPVDSVDAFYGRVSMTVAPIRLGGGIKVKVIESLARGVPVVGTPFALDGFPPGFADGAMLQTSLEDPDFSGVYDLEPVDPESRELDVLRLSTGTDRVVCLVRELIR